MKPIKSSEGLWFGIEPARIRHGDMTMARKRRGSLKRISASNLKKLLKAETKEDLIKMILGLEGGEKVAHANLLGFRVTNRKRRGPGRPRKHRGPGRPRKVGRPRKGGRGSYARTARRDRLGRIMAKTSRGARKRGPGRPRKHRGPGRPRKVGRPAKRRSSKRGSYAKTGQRYTSGPLKGKLMPRSHVSASVLHSIPGIKQPKHMGSLERSGGSYWGTGE